MKLRNDTGAVMLEYVLLLTLFACGIVAWSSAVYTDWHGFGSLGQGVVDMFQRVMSGISLPVP